MLNLFQHLYDLKKSGLILIYVGARCFQQAENTGEHKLSANEMLRTHDSTFEVQFNVKFSVWQIKLKVFSKKTINVFINHCAYSFKASYAFNSSHICFFNLLRISLLLS